MGVRRTVLLRGMLAMLVTAAVLAPAPASAGGDGGLVRVRNGLVHGTVDGHGRDFYAIPYAAPPTGARRFRPPQAAANWSGIRDTTAKGPICPQAAPLGTVSEDCLTLNVYTPPAATSRKLPVMVWIHGGAYILGTGTGEDPARLVAKGVIVVSIQYRLGPFGFMALPSLAKESGTTGNYGLQDQQAALRWVRANIATFGGDPHNVTIFGESAGGNSTCMQLISPTAAGLFDKAISESGGCVGTALGPRTAAAAYTSSQNFATSIGCTTVACLRGKSISDLLSGAGNPLGTPAWIPAIDGTVLTEPTKTALQTGRYNKVPLLSGTNKDEGRLFTALLIHLTKLRHANTDDLKTEITARAGHLDHKLLSAYPPASTDNADLAISQVTTDGAFSCPALFTAQAAATNPGQKVYAYEFSDPDPPISGLDPLMPLGDFHSSELPYLFTTLESVPVPLNNHQTTLSNQITDYWTTFARTGNPNNPHTPTWPTFTTTSPRLQRLTSQGTTPFTTFPTEHKCHLWQ